jgi:hypothetical protein
MRGGLWFGGGRCGIFCDCGVEHGVELSDIIDFDEALVGDDEDGRGLGETDALAQGLIGVYLGGEETVRVDDERHHAAMRLKVLLREGVEVVFRGNGDLVSEDGAAVLFRGLGGDLVLDVAGDHRCVKAPDVHAQREVVAKKGDFIFVHSRMHDGEGVGAGGALKIFKFVDGDRGSGGSAKHGRVFEGLSEGRDGGRKGEEQGCGEDDAVHCYKTHRIIFRILAEGEERGPFSRDFCIARGVWHSNRRA